MVVQSIKVITKTEREAERKEKLGSTFNKGSLCMTTDSVPLQYHTYLNALVIPADPEVPELFTIQNPGTVCYLIVRIVLHRDGGIEIMSSPFD